MPISRQVNAQATTHKALRRLHLDQVPYRTGVDRLHPLRAAVALVRLAEVDGVAAEADRQGVAQHLVEHLDGERFLCENGIDSLTTLLSERPTV